MKYLVGTILFTAIALAADGDDRAKLIGSWASHPNTESADGWTIESRGGGLHLTEMQADRKIADFECNTAGRECSIKDSGKTAKISMWFNGPMLVLMETRGSEVTKKRFHAAENDQLEVEVIPIVPASKPETVRFTRVQAQR